MKKFFKITGIVLLFIILFLAGMGIAMLNNDSGTELPKIKMPQYHYQYPDDATVRPLGRTYFDGSERHFSMSGSGVEFAFKGEFAELTFTCEGAESMVSHHRPRLAVLLNGETVIDTVLETEETTLRIDTDNTQQSVVTVIKLSEAKHSGFALKKISSYGTAKAEPTQDKAIKIEFIGDSITCGYGIDDIYSYTSFSTRTENFMKTYAYLTADALDADFSAVAFSGYGVVSGYTDNGKKNSDAIVSKYYSKACFLADGTEPYWDFSNELMDIVVINLGTNDASYCSKSSSRRAEFTEEYVKLLETVRSCNPKAYILCILGDMNNSLYPNIQQAVERYTATSLDSRVEAMTVYYNMGENDIVTDGHPGALSNAAASETLIARIRELISEGKIF